MKTYDDWLATIGRLKRDRWTKILAGEPVGRPAGRRPRDPEQERLLLRLDRARLARRATADLVVRVRRSSDDP